MKQANKLIEETSPYLLQHAYNPVKWYPWGEQALRKANEEDKLIVVSIGYSACHWCHVMEHESFEDEEVASVMNQNFVCIKVDREERPDIDAVYMQAVQLMTGRGGWPLNIIALPNGKPVYGGTYFRKSQWISVLEQVAAFYKNERGKCIAYGNDLADGVKQMQTQVDKKSEQQFSEVHFQNGYDSWSKQFDFVEGGSNRAPKFPMPNNYLYLLRYAHQSGNQSCLQYVYHTLNKIAFGGIRDHLRGGFARYATDVLWKVPHFEKMLYDNAQLISLYSEAFRKSKNELYKQVVYETFDFVINELWSNEGSFFSALDADSEGVEGKFYVWSKEQVDSLLGTNATLFSDYYNVNEIGYWEHNNYILLRKDEDENVASKYNITVEQLHERLEACKAKLIQHQNLRIRPGLDDKQLASWNALMLKASIDAFLVFNDERFLNTALQNAAFIKQKLFDSNGKLFRNYKNSTTTIPAFLEDFALLIDAWIALYQSTFNENWLIEAKNLLDHSIESFYDEEAGLFLFNSINAETLFSHHFEIHDNVIPASNSVMANNLFILSHYFLSDLYLQKAILMAKKMEADFILHGSSYSNWGNLFLKMTYPFYEICFNGFEPNQIVETQKENYQPNTLVVSTHANSQIPLAANRYVENQNLIYVCSNGACQLPVESWEDAMALIK